ncbi:MAG: hypothetical protein STSR0009_08660 [Methanoregula sp.]
MKSWLMSGALTLVFIAAILASGCTDTVSSITRTPVSTPTPQIIYVTVMVTPTPGSTAAPVEPVTVVTAKTTPVPTSVYTGLVVPTSQPSNQVLIDETYIAQYNNWYCADVQQAIGQPYLYPDEKYKLFASSSTSREWGHTNVLLLQDNDYLIFKTILPRWDDIEKTFKYDGIVPVVQFNDVMSLRGKTFSVKTTGKYYICLDDRQSEAGGYTIHSRAPAFEAYVRLVKNPA